MKQMKLNRLTLLGTALSLASALSVSGYTTQVLANSSHKAVSSTTASIEANANVTQNQPEAIMSGTFAAAEHPTTGMARIVNEKGQRYLVLDSTFSTNNQGPDLHVLLEPSERPPQAYMNHSGYVNLGKLQKFSGEQRYPIPTAVDLKDFKSVSVWCRMANATFGYAPLRPAGTASTSSADID